jgi:hypothetical protein
MKYGKGLKEVNSMYRSVASPYQDSETKINVNVTISPIETQDSSDKEFNLELSQQKLTEAIIWSEVLGKPLCKRRKSR